jgi:hypothetical protein
MNTETHGLPRVHRPFLVSAEAGQGAQQHTCKFLLRKGARWCAERSVLSVFIRGYWVGWLGLRPE